MATIHFVSGNRGKARVFVDCVAAAGFTAEHVELSLVEPQADTVEAVALAKAQQAFARLRAPLVVEGSPACCGSPLRCPHAPAGSSQRWSTSMATARCTRFSTTGAAACWRSKRTTRLARRRGRRCGASSSPRGRRGRWSRCPRPSVTRCGRGGTRIRYMHSWPGGSGRANVEQTNPDRRLDWLARPRIAARRRAILRGRSPLSTPRPPGPRCRTPIPAACTRPCRSSVQAGATPARGEAAPGIKPRARDRRTAAR